MKSGWVFLIFMVSLLASLFTLSYFKIAEKSIRLIANFAMWINAHPILQNALFIGFAGFIIYLIVDFLRRLEWK